MSGDAARAIAGPSRTAVEQQVRAAAAGASTDPMLLVLGDAGIGKTHLVRDALAATSGRAVRAVTCHDGDGDLPFGLLSLLVAPEDLGDEAIPPMHRRVLEIALGAASGPPAEPLALGSALATLLDATAAGSDGLTITIDDVDLADRSSLKVLGFACRRMVEDVAVVMSGRTRPADLPGDCTVVELPSMSAEQLVPLLTDHGWSLDAPVVRRVHDRTAGNPLATLTLARTARTVGELTGGRHAPPDVGQTIRDAFGETVAALPSATRLALLQLVAAAGVPTPQRWAAIDDPRSLDPAIDAGILNPADLSISHPLLRSAIWFSADVADRRRAQLAVAGRVTDEDRRAWLLAAATVGTDDAVAALLDDAAVRAAHRGAPSEAAGASARAAQLSDQPGPGGARHLAAAGHHLVAGEPLAALPHLDAASDVADPGVAAEAVRLRGRVLAFSGDVEGAEAVLLGTAARLRPVQPHLADRLTAEAIWPRAIANRWGAAWQLIDDIVTRRGADDPLTDAAWVGARAAAGLSFSPEGTDRIATRFLGCQPDDPDLLLLGYLVMNVGILAEDDGAVDRAAAKLLDLGRGGGAVGLLPLTLSVLSDARWGRGRWFDAMAEATEAVELAEELGQAVNAARARVTIARIALQTVERRAQGWAAVETELGSAVTWSRSAILGAAGLGHLVEGRVDEAVAALEESARLADDPVTGLHHRRISASGADLCTALVVAGERDEAARWLSRWASGAGASSRWARGAAARCGALLTSGDEAERASADATELLDDAPFEQARALLELARRRRSERRDDWRAPARTALGRFMNLGATAWALQVRELLGAAHVDDPDVAAPAAMALSDAEMRIARLVVEGRTNREIATALFLSIKTVEGHLTRMYSRLGIRSRVDLTRLLR